MAAVFIYRKFENQKNTFMVVQYMTEQVFECEKLISGIIFHTQHHSNIILAENPKWPPFFFSTVGVTIVEINNVY